MAENLLKDLNDIGAPDYHLYDLNTDCRLFSVHVALSAYFKQQKKDHYISFASFISNVLSACETTESNEKYIKHLNKCERSKKPFNILNEPCLGFEPNAARRRHLLEYIIDGVLHETIHVNLLKTIAKKYEADFEMLSVERDDREYYAKKLFKYFNDGYEKRLCLVWMQGQDLYYLISKRKVVNFNKILKNTKKMWDEYCKNEPIEYISSIVKFFPEITDYDDILKNYSNGIGIVFAVVANIKSNIFFFYLS